MVEQAGSPLELYDNPANLFVAGFIGSPKNEFLQGVVENTRPEHFNDSGSARLDFTIDLLEHLGGWTFASARHSAGDLVIIKTKNGRNLKSGQKFVARFDPGSALLFDGSGQRTY